MMWFVIACTSKPPPVVPIARVIRTQEDADELDRLVRALEAQVDAPPPLHITLDGPATVLSDLGYVDGEGHALDIELDGGGRALHGYSLRIEGRRISVRNLALTGGNSDYALSLSATDSITLSKIYAEDSPPYKRDGGKHFRGGALLLSASGEVRVEADEVTVVDAQSEYSVLFETSGRGYHREVLWNNGRFGNCPAPELGGRVTSFRAPGTLRMKPSSGKNTPFVPDDWLDGRPADWTEIPYDEATLARWRAR